MLGLLGTHSYWKSVFVATMTMFIYSRKGYFALVSCIRCILIIFLVHKVVFGFVGTLQRLSRLWALMDLVDNT
jgi:hypothetical protein